MKKQTEELKKQNCDIPDEPESSCKVDCQKSKDMLANQTDAVKVQEEGYKTKCEDKSRKLQAPTPDKKPDPTDDECTKMKNELPMQKVLLAYVEANSKKVCKCNEPVKPKPKPPTCKEL